MKALVKDKAAPGLDLLEVAKPEIGPEDVLIEVELSAICGTDLHIYNWDDWAAKTTTWRSASASPERVISPVGFAATAGPAGGICAAIRWAWA